MVDMAKLFPVALSDIEISIEKNVFMEPSASFNLKIKGTGEVELRPSNYSLIEPSPSSIETELVKDIIAAALEIGFFEMKSEYTEESILEVTPEGTIEQGMGGILDGEATTYSIKMGNQKKSIYAHWGYPKRLVGSVGGCDCGAGNKIDWFAGHTFIDLYYLSYLLP